ncbi:hypothetical protein [Celerinatantimonas sp. MCCC 1A17872]|uniref:hypothetical protein n=1 Tax=Celerinatantimonas sp. MCCC 1A17872 TaxID=3177514 RepID=UPI0038C7AE75
MVHQACKIKSNIHAQTSDGMISLEPKELEERLGSICFELNVHCCTANQNVTCQLSDVWVSYSELNAFESQLLNQEVAQLIDMSGDCVLLIKASSDFTLIELNPDIEPLVKASPSVKVILLTKTSIKDALYQAMRDYPKWW